MQSEIRVRKDILIGKESFFLFFRLDSKHLVLSLHLDKEIGRLNCFRYYSIWSEVEWLLSHPSVILDLSLHPKEIGAE